MKDQVVPKLSAGLLATLALVSSTTSPAWASLHCPKYYLRVPVFEGFTTHEFCVAKYEAKRKGKLGASLPEQAPWLDINRADAKLACQANGPGYRMIRNSEWQAVARNVESVAENWSGRAVGKGALSSGHSDYIPPRPLAASSDDQLACFGTDQSCNATTWNWQRRTNRLTTGEWIWDLAGNAWDMVEDDTSKLGVSPQIPEDWAEPGMASRFPAVSSATNQQLFGPSNSRYTWNQGIGFVGSYRLGEITARGANFDDFLMSGVFAVLLGAGPDDKGWEGVGFRCVYDPGGSP